MAQMNLTPGAEEGLVFLKSDSDNAELHDIDGDVSIHSQAVDYWAALLRKNLSKAQAIKKAEYDDEENEAEMLLEIDEEIMEAPRRKSARDAFARQVATRLYPAPSDSLSPIIKYEKDIVMLRSIVLDQRRSAISDATHRNAQRHWPYLISKRGAWDEINDPLPLFGAASLPMPVEQSDKESLSPFFAHLAANGSTEPSFTSLDDKSGSSGVETHYDIKLIEFEKGILYADGRVDLCKMVTGPRNIEDLMNALKSNTFAKHFLLGNNIVGPIGAKAIANFIDENPDRFETWYLAGNCIDTPGLVVLVDSIIRSSTISNVWLKRNPLGVDSVRHIFRLITETRNLRTLDLDQTELTDTGVAKLFELLARHIPSRPLPLRHIYLNACGIGEKACLQISQYLQSPDCSLESLYISNNPIGNAATLLGADLRANTSLKRIVLQSCGLKDDGIIALANALENHGSITVFDIGQSYATEDLGMRYNWATDESMDSLAKLVKNSKLQYLDLSYTPASQHSLNKVLAAITNSESLVWFHVKPLFTGDRDAASVKLGQEYARLHKMAKERLHKNVKKQYNMDYVRFESEKKRFLVSPPDVRLINSMYRNRDAGAARRGLKKLEKWWDADDKTLRRVQDGTLT